MPGQFDPFSLKFEFSYDQRYPEAPTRARENMTRHAGEMLLMKLESGRDYWVTVDYHEIPADPPYWDRINCRLAVHVHPHQPLSNAELYNNHDFYGMVARETWRRLRRWWVFCIQPKFKRKRSKWPGKVGK